MFESCACIREGKRRGYGSFDSECITEFVYVGGTCGRTQPYRLAVA